jgi:hypothetical protein
VAPTRVCLVTKRPHAASDRVVDAVVRRLTAAGARVLQVRRADDGARVVAALYPAAHARYTTAPTSEATWAALRARFDGERFTTVFGEQYSPDLVVPGAEAVNRFGLTEPDLTEIWEEGRPPVSMETLADRYGSAAAGALTGGDSHYDWFRGEWPVGIQRIAPGLVAFAMRHERLGGGRPVIVLNGYVPGLAALFGAGSAIVEVDLGGLSVAELRRHVVGHDNRPERCEPGTIRRDAADGLFPLDPGPPVDSRHNVVHCSDGLLAGEIETRALLGSGPGALTERLRAEGLTTEELETIVLRDPAVGEQALTDATRGASLDDCVRTITRYFPPVFGAANGFASGLALATFVREFRSPEEEPPDELHAITASPPPPEHEEAGGAAIAKVAFVVPAGGTGGRFGGYDLPEDHPDRQKALVRAFQVGGKPVCGLDIRLANARHWRAATGARLPVAVMASPTNHAAITAWADDEDLLVYRQHGVYRLRATGRERWFDEVVRDPDGTPSLKPPGNLGTLTCLALSGILDTWAHDGIEYLAIANGDDVGFRLDPRIVGVLAADPALDVVAAGVPWRPGDRGGAIGAVRGRIGIVETSGADSLLYNTNQFVVRVAALRRVLGLPADDTVEAVRRFVDKQPFHVEQKRVGTADALQLEQRMHPVFTQLRMAAVRLSRSGPPETRGSYAALKRPEDVTFGQWLLDTMAAAGDDLAF